jgi:hypothetical protein
MASTVFTAFLILPFSVKAQTQDSIVKKVTRSAAETFAERMPFSIDFKQYGNYNFTSSLRGQDLPAGTVTNWSQFTASANINLIQRRRWLLQGNAFYRVINEESNFSGSVAGVPQRSKNEYQYFTEGLNISYFSRLFGKTVIYSAGVNVDGSERSFERIRGLFFGSLVLKADDKTRMNVGLLASTDPSSMLPGVPIPTFLYQHKFNNGLEADLFLPQYLYVRKQMFGNGRLSAGWELDPNTTFFLYNAGQDRKTYQYRQIDLNMGLAYEHILPGHIVLGLRAGYRMNPYSRAFEKDRSFSDYAWKASNDPAPYVNLGLSFNPFAKRKK